MKWYAKILIAIASIVILVLLLNVGLNFWIARKLPQIINEQNNSPYQITYKELKISLLDRNLHATEIIAVPKVSLNAVASKEGYYAKIRSVDINGFSIWNILSGNRITAKRLIINYPEAILFRGVPKKEKKKLLGNVAYFNKIIYVSDIVIKHGNFGITDIVKNEQVLKISNISFQMEGIFIDDKTLSQKIPFTYQDFKFGSDSLYYRMPFYSIRTKKVAATARTVVIEAPKLIPLYSRKTFVKMISVEKDLYTVASKNISLKNIDWGFKGDDFFFHTTSLLLNGLDANAYRGKMVQDDLKKKKLFSRMLREIKYDLKVDTLRIKNATIVYEEEKDAAHGAGKIAFNRFNLYAVNVQSGFKKKKVPDVNIHITSKFMGVSPFTADWSFNVLDKSDGFKIKGRLLHFPAEKLAPFTKPYSNTIVQGDLEEIYFDFSGNDLKSQGTFSINYDNLKVKVYRKNDRKKKNKLLSAIVNLFVKNDSKERIKSTKVSVDRVPEKSFFNLLWITAADGLKKILL